MEDEYSEVELNLEGDGGYSDGSVRIYLNKLFESYRHHQKEKNTMAWVLSTQKQFNYHSFEKQILLQVDQNQPYLDLDINYDKYWNVSVAIALQIIRLLQRYLQIELQLPIKKLPHKDAKHLTKKIINKIDFSAKHWTTIVKIATFKYDFADVQLQKQECLSLYEHLVLSTSMYESDKKAMIEVVQRKVVKFEDIQSEFIMKTDNSEKCPQTNPTFYLNKIWNLKHEEELVNAFRKKLCFVEISNHFHDIYPHLSKYFKSVALKNRMRRIFRICLQNLKKKVISKYYSQLPRLHYYSQSICKNFQRSPGCLQIQLLLLKIWDNSFTIGDMATLINKMNAFISQSNEQKKAGVQCRGRKKKMIFKQD